MPLNDSLALGHELAERLRVRKKLAWISYSDARSIAVSTSFTVAVAVPVPLVR